MSVRTAASACSRVGLAATGSGAARTWSDRDPCSAGDDLGQGLTTASIAVSPFDRPEAGGVTGTAASVIRAWKDSTHARRPDAAFPFYMACVWLYAAKAGGGSRALARACRPLPIYSCKRDAQSPRRAITACEAHVERGLQQPNSRIGGEYSPPRPACRSPRVSDGAFQALRLDRHRRPQNGRRHRYRLLAPGESLRSRAGFLVYHGPQCHRVEGRRVARPARGGAADAEGKCRAAERQMGRHRRARTGARLQGTPRFDHADIRCRHRRDRSDRGQAQSDDGGRMTSLEWRIQPSIEARG